MNENSKTRSGRKLRKGYVYTEVPNKSPYTFLIRKFQTDVRASTGAYFTAYIVYTRVYLAYIKARKL